MQPLVRGSARFFTVLALVLALGLGAVVALNAGGGRGLFGTAAAPAMVSDPDAVSWADGRIDVFGRAGDNGLWYQTWTDDSWVAPEALRGVVASGPGVASWGPNRLDVFMRGERDQLHHKSYDGQWDPWFSLTPWGDIQSDPAAVSWGPDRVDVFAKGKSGGLYHLWYDGSGWEGPEDLGGQPTGGPAVASWGAGRLDVFIRGADNQLWHKWFDGQWSNAVLPDTQGWEPLGGELASDPAAVSWGPNRIDVVARGTDGQLHRLVWAGTWQNWTSIGGNGEGGPAVVSQAAGKLDVFERGADNRLRQRTFSEGRWRDWTMVPCPGC